MFSRGVHYWIYVTSLYLPAHSAEQSEFVCTNRAEQPPPVVDVSSLWLFLYCCKALSSFLRVSSFYSCFWRADTHVWVLVTPLKRCSQSRVTMSHGQPGCFPVWCAEEEKLCPWGEVSVERHEVKFTSRKLIASGWAKYVLQMKEPLSEGRSPGLQGPSKPQSEADLHLSHTLFSLYPLDQTSTSRTFLSSPESCIFILKNIDGKYLACRSSMVIRKILEYLWT